MNLPSAAPWWGVPVIAGCFLLLGAILGYVFNRLNERAKMQRDDALLSRDEVKKTCQEFLTLAREASSMASHARNANKDITQEQRAAAAEGVMNITETMFANLSVFELFAPASVADPARDLAVSVMKLSTYALYGTKGAMAEYTKTRKAFIDGARIALRVPGSLSWPTDERKSTPWWSAHKLGRFF